MYSFKDYSAAWKRDLKICMPVGAACDIKTAFAISVLHAIPTAGLRNCLLPHCDGLLLLVADNWTFLETICPLPVRKGH